VRKGIWLRQSPSERVDELLHLRDDQRRHVDLAVGRPAISCLELLLESRGLRAGHDQRNIVAFGLVECARSFPRAILEAGTSRLS
jgi:hypothetical protein